MSIDTLPKAEPKETEAIKQFDSFAEATAWIENAAQKMGERTLAVKRAETHNTHIVYGSAEQMNIETASAFNKANVRVLFRQNNEEKLPDYPSLKHPPKGGWPVRDAGCNVSMHVVDEAGGEYDLTHEKYISDESMFLTNIKTSLSYTTNRGTDIEHTTTVEVDTESLRNQHDDGDEAVAEYTELAAGLRSAIMWKVESVAPEMKSELESKYKRMGFMKRAMGRLAWGKSTELLS